MSDYLQRLTAWKCYSTGYPVFGALVRPQLRAQRRLALGPPALRPVGWCFPLTSRSRSVLDQY